MRTSMNENGRSGSKSYEKVLEDSLNLHQDMRKLERDYDQLKRAYEKMSNELMEAKKQLETPCSTEESSKSGIPSDVTESDLGLFRSGVVHSLIKKGVSRALLELKADCLLDVSKGGKEALETLGLEDMGLPYVHISPFLRGFQALQVKPSKISSITWSYIQRYVISSESEVASKIENISSSLITYKAPSGKKASGNGRKYPEQGSQGFLQCFDSKRKGVRSERITIPVKEFIDEWMVKNSLERKSKEDLRGLLVELEKNKSGWRYDMTGKYFDFSGLQHNVESGSCAFFSCDVVRILFLSIFRDHDERDEDYDGIQGASKTTLSLTQVAILDTAVFQQVYSKIRDILKGMGDRTMPSLDRLDEGEVIVNLRRLARQFILSRQSCFCCRVVDLEGLPDSAAMEQIPMWKVEEITGVPSHEIGAGDGTGSLCPIRNGTPVDTPRDASSNPPDSNPNLMGGNQENDLDSEPCRDIPIGERDDREDDEGEREREDEQEESDHEEHVEDEANIPPRRDLDAARNTDTPSRPRRANAGFHSRWNRTEEKDDDDHDYDDLGRKRTDEATRRDSRTPKKARKYAFQRNDLLRNR